MHALSEEQVYSSKPKGRRNLLVVLTFSSSSFNLCKSSNIMLGTWQIAHPLSVNRAGD